MRVVGIYIALCLATTYGYCQIDTTQSVDFLVKKILLGNGVLVGNVQFTGSKHAIGLYTDSTNQVGIEKGILLTSGNAFYALGPNKTPRSGWAGNGKGDEELDRIARGKTYDASVLEFDFVTVSENVSFEFVFGSEEYLEYVGSQFNDVFAFFVSGKDKKKTNIARLPDGKTPITVNTVNNKSNKEYYIDNTYTNTTDPFVWDVRNKKVIQNEHFLLPEIPPKYNIQFDGFTTVLKAVSAVVPNEVYHIKIVISDVGDGILDSGVFLKGGSFTSSGNQVVALDNHFRQEPTEKIKPLPVALNVQEKPLNKVPTYLPIPTVIEFSFDRSNLSETAIGSIENLYKFWKETPKATIKILGHTDSWGHESYNLQLSKERSEAVAKSLIDMGVPKDLIAIVSMGESSPVQPNNNLYGRARNRRVEVIVSL